jgi:transposase
MWSNFLGVSEPGENWRKARNGAIPVVMGLVAKDDHWKIPDALWAKMERLLPPRPAHPLGCHNPRVPDRKAMEAILFVLRTGCPWNALNATGICKSSSAHRRFVEWVDEGVFHEFWRQGLLEYDRVKGIDWTWLSMDGAMTKAPLGGEKNRAKPNRPRQGRNEAQPPDGRLGHPPRPRGRWRKSERPQAVR